MSEVIRQIEVVSVSPIPVGRPDRSLWAVRVEFNGIDKWAIRNGSRCLSRAGEWVQEPIPSSRTDEWLAEHRFDADEAAVIAHKVCGSVTWNGRTADQIAGGAS